MATNRIQIETLHEIKSDGLWFQPGEIHTVDKSIGDKFIQHGWAKEKGEEPAPPPDLSDKTLDVQNGKHVSGSTSPG